MDRTRTPRSPATWGLLALATAVTAVPVASAVRSVLVAAGVLRVGDDEAFTGGLAGAGFYDARGVRIAEGFAAVVSIPVAISCLLVLLGLVTWRDWAREGALGVFGLGGLFLLVLSLNGLASDPPGEHADLGLVASLLVLGVAALVLSPPVRGDFEGRQIARAQRERAAAAAARRARAGG